MDRIPGGLADGMKDSDFPKDQIQKGIEVEMEHTDDPEIAKEISEDHLTESDSYYDYLDNMEKTIEKDKAKESFLNELIVKFSNVLGESSGSEFNLLNAFIDFCIASRDLEEEDKHKIAKLFREFTNELSGESTDTGQELAYKESKNIQDLISKYAEGSGMFETLGKGVGALAGGALGVAIPIPVIDDIIMGYLGGKLGSSVGRKVDEWLASNDKSKEDLQLMGDEEKQSLGKFVGIDNISTDNTEESSNA